MGRCPKSFGFDLCNAAICSCKIRRAVKLVFRHRLFALGIVGCLCLSTIGSGVFSCAFDPALKFFSAWLRFLNSRTVRPLSILPIHRIDRYDPLFAKLANIDAVYQFAVCNRFAQRAFVQSP